MTVQAYHETHYRVYTDLPLTLHVGVASAPLSALYKSRRVQSCAFITACNPLGQCVCESVNVQRQETLARQLRQRSLQFIEGTGQHPTNGWPGEASFLVWSLPLEAGKVLGRQHQQNAIVWCASDAVPQLVLLR